MKVDAKGEDNLLLTRGTNSKTVQEFWFNRERAISINVTDRIADGSKYLEDLNETLEGKIVFNMAPRDL